MLKFLVFADLHYKKGMYASTMAHLEAIMQRAHAEKVDFVIHLGDFCNDYAGSPEIVDMYLNNSYGLPAYGIYGNHELETKGNCMKNVTPLLCNRDVVFGKNGAGYWYCDIGAYRLTGLDTNYSYNAGLSQWQHNTPASWGAPDGNLYSDSLGPKQLKWLEAIIADAAEKGLKVLVFSHDGLSDEWHSSPDAEAVREIFGRYNGTVIMCLNGHLHSDHFCIKDGIAYFDVNTVLNGFWKISDSQHYTDEHTFIREVPGTGDTEIVRLNTLSQAMNTWFFEDPLSAIVEICDDGIRIKGSTTSWKYGIAPSDRADGVHPAITGH